MGLGMFTASPVSLQQKHLCLAIKTAVKIFFCTWFKKSYVFCFLLILHSEGLCL